MVGGFEPKILICEDCGEEFVFTAQAQEYFADKGYTEEPKRCKHCYMKYKRDKKGQATSRNGNFISQQDASYFGRAK
ncbi:MAG: zinc-ribbon domain-containing protein [candidate division Zixibacteria bacterium]|nr:zinc-ribbon domain-containing protein [candidate division Zixibacteria bacterium]